MKKYFKELIRFSLVCIPGYFVLLILWGIIPYSHNGSNLKYKQGSYGHLNTRVKEISGFGEVDILFVGSSRIYRGFDPRIFENYGVRVFVLGSSGQTPVQSYILLKRYLKELNPGLIVFDLFPRSFSKKGVESSLDLLANDQIDSLSMNMARKQDDILVWNTFIYAKLRQWMGMHQEFKEPRFKADRGDRYVSGGYVHKELKFHQKIDCEDTEEVKWAAPNPLQTDYFNKIINLVGKMNIELQLINMPIANYECYSNNDILQPLWKETKLDYIDFNKVLTWRDSIDFYDNFHLNEIGVKKLNTYFVDQIIEVDSQE